MNNSAAEMDRSGRDMLGRNDAMPLGEALRIIAANLPAAVVEEEELLLADALGRINSRNIRSPENLPPYPRSTMDGFAVRATDTFGATEQLPAYLEIHGEVRMGQMSATGPRPGGCFKIATGGNLPPGTDAVVMLEHTVPVDEALIEVVQPVPQAGNVIVAGEDLREGELVVAAGRCFSPRDLGLLAGLGISSVHVRRRLRVGIFSTGDEIVSFDQIPPAGKIRDMNGPHIAALIVETGGIPSWYGIVGDEEARFKMVLETAIAENDLVVFSGSSSVGLKDLGERVLAGFGPPGIVVHGVAIKPGKPVLVAVVRGRPVFGLPGHPVSAAVTFDLFVRPALARLSGGKDQLFSRPGQEARLMRNINSAAGRTDYIRVQLKQGSDGAFEAHPLLGKSGALSSFAWADGYLVVAQDLQGIRAGEMVRVQLLD